MVAGHLTLKNGRYYAVLNYRNAGGQRKTKWISLGLPEKGNKRKAEAELARIRAELEPPKEVGDPSSDMLFADYLLEWLEIAKGRLAVATYSSYAAMINKPIGPYFRQRNLTLRELEARHLQMFYSEMLRKVKPNTVIHYHAIIHSALKYAVKTDMLVQNVADKVDTPTWITSLKSPRHRRWRQGLRYRRAATSEAGGDRLMLGGTDDFLSEKVKEHGIARFGKRKEPVIGLITGS